jgi:hypothetical protein
MKIISQGGRGQQQKRLKLNLTENETTERWNFKALGSNGVYGRSVDGIFLKHISDCK